MIKFSWEKINNKFNWNGYSVLEYFFLMQHVSMPKYLNRKIPAIVKTAAMQPYESGPCFLINPNVALKRAPSPNELHLYLETASKRNIFDYLIRGVKHTPLVLVPEYQHKWIEINPMMQIEKENIYFLYEQETKQYGY